MANSRRSGKNGWSLFLLILAGIVIGSLIGELASNVAFLNWLGKGYSFGLQDAINLDLQIMTLVFGIKFRITVASIVGIGLAIFAYRKI